MNSAIKNVLLNFEYFYWKLYYIDVYRPQTMQLFFFIYLCFLEFLFLYNFIYYIST